jgi:Tol biopolymer transport system component
MTRFAPGGTLACAIIAAAALPGFAPGPPRVPVLSQIALPHNYYFRELYLPQLTSGPSAVSWSPDGAEVVYSMHGSLWRQRIDGRVAEQLTDDRGSDYQPDWSPDGRTIAFVRYDGRAMELMALDVASGRVRALTSGPSTPLGAGAVNVEPRWSPRGDRLAFVSTAGTGHFLLHVAAIRDGRVASSRVVTPDRRSAIARYYYSAFDHAINPTWTRDGRELLFVSNREIAHGTGDIVRMNADEGGAALAVHHEETSWRARPDVSPDGTRIVYSSYLGRQWQQLWLLPVDGGYPFPLTYGEHDDTGPRWSPDGRTIAFISNRSGNTALWFVDAVSGEQRPLRIEERRYLRPHRPLTLRIVDETEREIAARVSVTDSRGRAYAPDDAWVHADDMLVPERDAFETRYFHTSGRSVIAVPSDRLAITVSRGPEYEVVRVEEDAARAAWSGTRVVTLRPLQRPPDWPDMWSGDLHVHMNYGGHYRNTPQRLGAQARAEDLDVVHNLIVNKEQRFPDIASFRTDPDSAAGGGVLILHGQEFHTSYWGHLGLLNLRRHLVLPGYAAYPYTAAASPYPHNTAIADIARRQQALVGYVHPFDTVVDPVREEVTNALPVDAALGKVDYYEAVGFSDPRATSEIWYRLLECGLQIPAGAGTDAMANYASLRGPVGLNRVYVPAASRSAPLTSDAFLAEIKKGRGMATNGPLLQLTANDAQPGDTVRLDAAAPLRYRYGMRANFSVDRLELIWNGAVARTLDIGAGRRSADGDGVLPVTGSGWLLLRAWNEGPDPNVMDAYPFATTSPVYVRVGDRPRRSPDAAAYFLRWLDRIQSATEANAAYRTAAERAQVLTDVARAREFYQQCAAGTPVR